MMATTAQNKAADALAAEILKRPSYLEHRARMFCRTLFRMVNALPTAERRPFIKGMLKELEAWLRPAAPATKPAARRKARRK
jgi:hypothetical protein